jgi:hypothetical protein
MPPCSRIQSRPGCSRSASSTVHSNVQSLTDALTDVVVRVGAEQQALVGDDVRERAFGGDLQVQIGQAAVRPDVVETVRPAFGL